jgi:hypothetical protein
METHQSFVELEPTTIQTVSLTQETVFNHI